MNPHFCINSSENLGQPCRTRFHRCLSLLRQARYTVAEHLKCEPESKLLSGGYIGRSIRVIEGANWRLDYGSCNLLGVQDNVRVAGYYGLGEVES